MCPHWYSSEFYLHSAKALKTSAVVSAVKQLQRRHSEMIETNLIIKIL